MEEQINQDELARRVVEKLEAARLDLQARNIRLGHLIHYTKLAVERRDYGRIGYWADRLDQWIAENNTAGCDMADAVQLLRLFHSAFAEEQ